MSTRSDCPFCAIVEGAGPARVVYGDEHTVAFLPLFPATVGHVLVVPREHVDDIWAMNPDLAGEVAKAVLRVAWGVRQALSPEGLNVINSSGAAASQTISHLHMHVVPRWEGDAMGAIWPQAQAGRDAEQDSVAARLRDACR
ncbi:MAG: HIT family protein [Hamadaea sp.]|nr:HIT family protein [Hamadaea sp.]